MPEDCNLNFSAMRIEGLEKNSICFIVYSVMLYQLHRLSSVCVCICILFDNTISDLTVLC
jgi:hypothetical protein